MRTYTVSVCMATYNGEKYLKEQLLSILGQLGVNDEVIISDDNSSDKTINIIEDFSDKRIKIFFNQSTAGYTNNFQNALQMATGDYIFLSDQDDVWLPNKVSRMVDLLQEYDFVVSDAAITNEQLVPNGTSYFGLRGGGKNGFITNLIKAKYLGCCMSFRKSLLHKVIPFPANVDLCPHDLWISMIAEFYYKTKVINESLVLYRRHGNNVSNGGAISSSRFLFKIKFRFYTLLKVVSRCTA